MALLSLLAGLLVVILLVILWRRFAYETVALGDVQARRRAAAEWMAKGEPDAAEEMLRAAVDVSEGWPEAVARGDLATLLLAMGRDKEAGESLQAALQIAPEGPEAREEMLELRISLAHILVKAGDSQAAEKVLLAARPEEESSIFSALAAEALGEFYVQEGRAAEAMASLQSALNLLASQEHDRAASAAVTLAYAGTLESSDEPWHCWAALSRDLQAAAVVNLCDRLGAFRPEARRALLSSLISLLADFAEYSAEREELRAALEQLGE